MQPEAWKHLPRQKLGNPSITRNLEVGDLGVGELRIWGAGESGCWGVGELRNWRIGEWGTGQKCEEGGEMLKSEAE